MPGVLHQIVEKTGNAYPPFNDFLLLEFRETKIRQMTEYLDRHFKTMQLFGGALKYSSYHILTPEERVKYLLERRFAAGVVQIQKRTTFLVQFNFVYEGKMMSFCTELPYVENHAVVIDGCVSYPLFVIMERVIHRVKSGVFIKVALAPLAFHRVQQLMYRSTRGYVLKDFLPTTKIHWGRGGLARKSSYKTPIILYHLCAWGFNETMKRYGLIVGTDVQFTTSDLGREGYLYFQLKPEVFLEVNESILDNKNHRRVIVSLLCILTICQSYTSIAQITNTSSEYFKLSLGYYTYSVENKALLYKNAVDHLNTVSTIVDPAAKYSMSTVGMRCEDAFDLLFQAFHNIDSWLIHNPADLYSKRFGALDHLLSGVLRTVAEQQFQVMRYRSGLDDKAIQRFLRHVSTGWSHRSALFRDATSTCHANWLLTIGAKRSRSSEVMEGHRFGTTKNASTALLSDVRRAHPSNMVVESLLAIPSSNPLLSGTINPYAEIDEDGNIIKPTIADSVAHVYDVGTNEPWGWSDADIDEQSDME